MAHFHGRELELRRAAGAAAVRVVHSAGQSIDWHRHDWPSLTLHLTGACTEHFEDGELTLNGPSAVLHPPGSLHRDRIHREGMETISLQFDPAWLRRGAGRHLGTDRSVGWTGGSIGLAARALASKWADGTVGECELARVTGDFLDRALACRPEWSPPWLAQVRQRLAAPEPPETKRLAQELGLHPAWLARAYRRAVGEGIQETVARLRVQRAALRLRETDLALADVSYAEGFCDQAHMTRAVRRVFGRSPLQIRRERHVSDAADHNANAPRLDAAKSAIRGIGAL